MIALAKLYHFLGGIYFAIVLIASVALFVVAGTFIESITESHRYASYFTYSNPVFITLLWGFFINILFSALRRWPFKLHHIPFLITHLGLLMILAGTLFKSYLGLQGIMHIVEGSGSHHVILPYTYGIYIEKRDPYNNSKTISYNFPIEREWSGFHSEINTNGDISNLKIELVEFIPNAKSQFESEFKENKNYPIDGKDFSVVESSLIMYDDGFGGYTIQTKLKSDKEEIVVEKPLKMVFEQLPLNSHLEENTPKITLKISSGSKNELISLPYDRFGDGLKWPIQYGKYLVRFQSMHQAIPHHLRLRNARQINYSESTQPYSYESDLLITDLNTHNMLEKTISMNNVHETWDGYRFYLANMTPSHENAIKKVQIAVNHDPAKHFLTYPGAIILCAGIISLFWLSQQRHKDHKDK